MSVLMKNKAITIHGIEEIADPLLFAKPAYKRKLLKMLMATKAHCTN